MLIAEAEDIFAMMNKFLPTVYKRLSTDEVITSKGTRDDYDRFWSILLPTQMEKLERLWDGPARNILFPPSLMPTRQYDRFIARNGTSAPSFKFQHPRLPTATCRSGRVVQKPMRTSTDAN